MAGDLIQAVRGVSLEAYYLADVCEVKSDNVAVAHHFADIRLAVDDACCFHFCFHQFVFAV